MSFVDGERALCFHGPLMYECKVSLRPFIRRVLFFFWCGSGAHPPNRPRDFNNL